MTLVTHVQRESEAWEVFRDSLRAQVPRSAWQNWLGSLRLVDVGHTLRIAAPSELHARWVTEKFGPAVDSAASQAYGLPVDITVDDTADGTPTGEPTMPEPVSKSLPPEPTVAAPAGFPARTGPGALIEKNTFENFVVGQSNRFAWAATMAVAEQPGRHYNPLFIYGGAGLGKTHLLHAVGHHVGELYPKKTVRYVTSETFFVEFIDGIRRKKMDDFKQRYRTTDVLLLDDVQFFEGKEQILEEFFHTFNTLYQAGSQMVISSDRPPRNLSTLEDRLRSRFEWGLLTDIRPPDVETRLAILERNADALGHAIPRDVLEFIASVVSDNIRELEGALNRVVALSRLTNQRIDVPTAQSCLRDLTDNHENHVVTPQAILDATAASYGFTREELIGPSRRQPLALSRQIAMYLCRDLTDLSLPKIGMVFGGRDHSTVLYGVDKVKSLMTRDRDVFDRVSELTQRLRTSR